MKTFTITVQDEAEAHQLEQWLGQLKTGTYHRWDQGDLPPEEMTAELAQALGAAYEQVKEGNVLSSETLHKRLDARFGS